MAKTTPPTGTATPPTTKTETPKDGEKKERAPRKDYGYRSGAKIVINKEAEIKYRGQRLDWYNTLKSFGGRPVESWEESRKGTKNGKGVVQSPRGWLRFYVLDGTVSLAGGEEVKETKAA